MSTAAAIAANRFGLGARPGELARIATDPRGWLEAQLSPTSGPAGLERVESLTWRLHRADKRSGKERRDISRSIYDHEVALRERYAATTRSPFQERLVRFWSNHFAVSITQIRCVGLVGNYERQAIRPYLGGSFRGLLGAVTHHPAMLLYLDQVRSVGPQSQAGLKRGRGLNENLARELMELHTLGVNGGYNQDDVRALAEILTGWGLEPGVRQDPFHFEPRRHQPGDKQLLGTTIRTGGEEEGQEALDLLANHPATARHIAEKLVRHFVSDAPTKEDVQTIADTFLHSEGHLPTVHRALIHLESAWDPSQRKLRTPADLVCAIARGVGYEGDGELLVQARRTLGQLPFAAPSPQGWSDRAEDWAGPDAVVARVDLARRVAAKVSLDRSVPQLAERLLGPFLSERTRKVMLSLSSPADQLSVLLGSPEFQWRAGVVS
ncbi:MAG: DUF1800 domain-containing protein [Myxococcota bacterium]|nr:DUF1800 domain-containing protein [Myxococcota bacterium]